MPLRPQQRAPTSWLGLRPAGTRTDEDSLATPLARREQRRVRPFSHVRKPGQEKDPDQGQGGPRAEAGGSRETSVMTPWGSLASKPSDTPVPRQPAPICLTADGLQPFSSADRIPG